jgi:hypothetical protein
MTQAEAPSRPDIDIDSTFGPGAKLTLALMRAELVQVECGETRGPWAMRPILGEAPANPALVPSAR